MDTDRSIASFSIAVVAALVLSAFTAPLAVSATQTEPGSVLVVDESGESGAYTSIQNAVDAANHGDTVEIRPGVYEESITIQEDITLRGSPGVVLDGSQGTEDDVGIKIYAAPRISDVVIRGYDGCVSGNGGGEWKLIGVTIQDCRTGVRGAGSANWLIRNSTISDTETAVMASGSTGDWVIRDSRLVGNRLFGVRATGASGAWRIRNSTFRGSNFGVSTPESTGAWSISDSRFRNVATGIIATRSEGSWVVSASTVTNASQTGISAPHSSSGWTVRDTTVLESAVGLNAYNSTGDWAAERSVFRENTVAITASSTSGKWRIENSTVRDSGITGVRAEDSSGNWRILNSVVRNTTRRSGGSAHAEGIGIYAANARGAWEVHGSTITANAVHGIAAYDSSRRGSATSNWWGDAAGPTGEQCVGNVDCSEPFTQSSQQGSYRATPPPAQSTVTSRPTTATAPATSRNSPTEGGAQQGQQVDANSHGGFPVDLSSPVVTFPAVLALLLFAIWYTE